MTAPSSSSATEFATLTCSAPEERAARMAELVLAEIRNQHLELAGRIVKPASK